MARFARAGSKIQNSCGGCKACNILLQLGHVCIFKTPWRHNKKSSHNHQLCAELKLKLIFRGLYYFAAFTSSFQESICRGFPEEMPLQCLCRNGMQLPKRMRHSTNKLQLP